MKVKVAIADDHQLIVAGLSRLIEEFEQFELALVASEGQDLLNKLSTASELPDIALIDVNMENGMGGIETTRRLQAGFPTIKVIALSSDDRDMPVISMIRAGACAYLIKNINPEELKLALVEVAEKGYYNSDWANINFRRIVKYEQNMQSAALSNKELAFLKLASSELTYKQIADKMNLSERTIDGYRESVFKKLNVISRVGMVLEGIRKGILSVN